MAARWVIAFLLAPAAWAAISVEIRDNEVWLVRDGSPRQLTHDGKSKWQTVLAPREDRVAYFEACPEAEHCTPAVVILDLDGNRLQSFAVGKANERCMSINRISWAGEDAIGAECHMNPSLSEYVETEIATGRVRRDLLGGNFTLSPDGKTVAHTGWIVHFAPPYAQSDYLQVEDTIIYPLPAGTAPVKQAALEQPPAIVQKVGETYRGIHEFMPGLAWSPDSQRIALIDCTYDWTPDTPEALSAAQGKESGHVCKLAIVSLDGRAQLFPLETGIREAQPVWTGRREIACGRRRFSVR